jgi:hypothetical protein
MTMEYTQKTLSKKLENLGVKSQSGMWRVSMVDEKTRLLKWKLWSKKVFLKAGFTPPDEWKEGEEREYIYPAYILSDFVGTHKEARENCKKIGKRFVKDYLKSHKAMFYNGVPVFDYNGQHERSVDQIRHQLIDSDDWRKELKLWLK